MYDQGSGTYIQLESSVATKYYLTSVTLISGVTYSFKITARNSVGSSVYSEALSVLAARIPDKPVSLANDESITTAYQVGLTWSDDFYTGGSSVIDY